jgi:uncharacterized membrane protein
MASEAPAPPPSRRIWAIDATRGAALAGMAIYHLSWDLAYFGVAPRTLPADPPMRLFSHGVASAFLLLVGVSLALAHASGINWRGYWRRLAIVAGAAALVTLATRAFAPDEAITFGILHCVALASLMALPLLNAPPWAALIAAALTFAAPLLPASALFDSPAMVWLGLSRWIPATLDWRPLFPWSGFVFLGLGATRAAYPRLDALPALQWRPRGAPARALAWAGRHSLAIYLAHQPILFGALFAWSSLTGFSERRAEQAFGETCQSECREGGGETRICATACRCVVYGLQNEGLAVAFTSRPLSNGQRDSYSRIVRACIAAK